MVSSLVMRLLLGITLIFLRRMIVGKYALGWFLGVPAFVLVIIYFLMN